MKKIIFNLSEDFRLDTETYAKMYELENNATEILIKTSSIMDGFVYQLHKEQNGIKNFVVMEKTAEGLSYTVNNGFIPKAGNACLQLRAVSDDIAIESNIVDFRIGRFINATEEPTPEQQTVINQLLVKAEVLSEKADELETLEVNPIEDGIEVSYDGKKYNITNGPEGPAGPAGPAGTPGHTPVKGEDYWTSEDKAEIVDEVTPVIDSAVSGKVAPIENRLDEVEVDVVNIDIRVRSIDNDLTVVDDKVGTVEEKLYGVKTDIEQLAIDVNEVKTWSIQAEEDIEAKQDKLTQDKNAGENIIIDANGRISATGGGSGDVTKAYVDAENAKQDAETASIKADLRQLSDNVDALNDIIGADSTEYEIPVGFKSANYENSSKTRAFHYLEDSKELEIYSKWGVGSIAIQQIAFSLANISLSEDIVVDCSSLNKLYLKITSSIKTEETASPELLIRCYNSSLTTNKPLIYPLPQGDSESVIDVLALMEEANIDKVTNGKIVIRQLSVAPHDNSIPNAYAKLKIIGFANSLSAKNRIDLLEDNVKSLDERVTALENKPVTTSDDSNLLVMKSLIPNYYLNFPTNPVSFEEQEYLEEKIKSVPQGKSFIFFTDSHWENNNKHGFEIMQYVRSRLGIKKVLFGGDYIDAQETKYLGANIMRDFMNRGILAFGTDYLATVGNHDSNLAGYTHGASVDENDVRIPYNIIYDGMVKHLESVANFEDLTNKIDSIAESDSDRAELIGWSKLHYFVDDDVEKTRYIVIYSSTPDSTLIPHYTGFAQDGGGGATTIMQYEWFANTLKSTPSGYDVIVMAHCADSEGTTSPTRQKLRNYFGFFTNIAGACIRKSSGYKINQSNFPSEAQTNAFWTREDKVFDFSNAPNLGKILFVAGHMHRNIEYVTRVTTDSPVNPAFDRGFARNNGNPALVDVETEVEVFDSSTVNFRGGEMLTIISQCDGYGQAIHNNKYRFEMASMTKDTITDQSFDVITLTDNGVVCTRFGAGWDRTIPVNWN